MHASRPDPMPAFKYEIDMACRQSLQYIQYYKYKQRYRTKANQENFSFVDASQHPSDDAALAQSK